MSDYQVTDIGPLDKWRDHFGGFDQARSRQGRRIIDHEITMQYIGISANALEPDEEAGYWHQHSEIEEVYIFLEGQRQMGLDDDLVDVGPGTLIRVGQGVLRTWRALPDSDRELKWLCIRSGGSPLLHLPDDSSRTPERPMPWTS